MENNGINSREIFKFLGFLTLIFGILVLFISQKDVIPFWFGNKEQKFVALWAEDLAVLARDNKLPKNWGDIRTIEPHPLNETVKAWLKSQSPPITTKSDGHFKLEVFLDDWVDKDDGPDSHETAGIMIQYNLVDLSTGDTVWELGRTLVLK